MWNHLWVTPYDREQNWPAGKYSSGASRFAVSPVNGAPPSECFENRDVLDHIGVNGEWIGAENHKVCLLAGRD